MRRYLTFILLCCVVGCTSNGSNSSDDFSNEPPIDPNLPPITTGSWYRPAVGTTWHWQLKNTINTTYSVDLYDIDLFDASAETIQSLHASGKKVLCYFSAGSYENWRPDTGQFPVTALGTSLEGWEGERWLDIRSDAVLTIMKNRLDLAVSKGCDGVEPDNVDGYSNNSGFNLTFKDQLFFNRTIANEAHLRGLSVGLKNDLEQVPQLIEYFDFSVDEQCVEYGECDALAPFIIAGKAVFSAEYQTKYVTSTSQRQALCNNTLNRGFSTLILPLELDNSFRYSCR